MASLLVTTLSGLRRRRRGNFCVGWILVFVRIRNTLHLGRLAFIYFFGAVSINNILFGIHTAPTLVRIRSIVNVRRVRAAQHGRPFLAGGHAQRSRRRFLAFHRALVRIVAGRIAGVHHRRNSDEEHQHQHDKREASRHDDDFGTRTASLFGPSANQITTASGCALVLYIFGHKTLMCADWQNVINHSVLICR